MYSTIKQGGVHLFEKKAGNEAKKRVSLRLPFQLAHTLRLKFTFLLRPPLLPSIPPTRDHLLRHQIRKQRFARHFHNPTPYKVNRHRCRQAEFELKKKVACVKKNGSDVRRQRKRYTHSRCHFDDLKPSVDFRDKVCRSTHCDRSSADETPVQRPVLPNAFSERTALQTLVRSEQDE